MSRKELVKRAYYRQQKLNVKHADYCNWLQTIAEGLIKEDLGKKGDITTKFVLKNNQTCNAMVRTKQAGIVAGLEEAIWVLQRHDIELKSQVRDGLTIKKGQLILEVRGQMANLLMIERIVLNLLQRMSGIATETNRLVRLAKPLVVAATRKTPWGALDNKAVAHGGGATHRLGLWDAILIKENHLAGIDIETALKRAWDHRNQAGFVEIEVETSAQAVTAAEVFKQLNGDTPRIIMFDNFSVEGIKKTVGLLKQNGLYDQVLLEASGGITPENITKYRDSGVDVVSLGYLTHSVQALDISMRIL